MKQPTDVKAQPCKNQGSIASNARKGMVTTVIGLVLIVAATVSVFTVDAVNWMDASIGILLGLGLVFAPDTILSNIRNFLNRLS
jgi:hypothetical protein